MAIRAHTKATVVVANWMVPSPPVKEIKQCIRKHTVGVMYMNDSWLSNLPDVVVCVLWDNRGPKRDNTIRLLDYTHTTTYYYYALLSFWIFLSCCFQNGNEASIAWMFIVGWSLRRPKVNWNYTWPNKCPLFFQNVYYISVFLVSQKV